MKDNAFYDRTLAITLVCFAIAFALILSACSTNTPVPTTVEQPTPQIIEKRVEVQVPVVAVPQSCIDYMNAILDASSAQSDAYNEGTQKTLDAANKALQYAATLRAACMRDGNLTEDSSTTAPEG